MDAETLLASRNSAPKLQAPAPSTSELDTILSYALRAPDHARLKPFRFISIRDDSRDKLGQLFVDAESGRRARSERQALTDSEIEKIQSKPLRAPLILVVVAVIKEHPKVPRIEQMLSAGCAAHSILLGAHARGFAGIWRTGQNAFDPSVKKGLKLESSEEIIGFLYLGTREGDPKPVRDQLVSDFHQEWY